MHRLAGLFIGRLRKVKDNAAGAIGGLWRWKHPETGYVITHSNFTGCKNEVRRFLRTNNFPIGTNFDQEFEENLCANGAPNLCEEFVPPSLLQKMSTLGQVLYRTSKNLRHPVVTAEVLQQRRDICTTCNYFAGSTSLLKIACSKCGCSGLALYLIEKHCPLSPPKW